MVWWVSFLTVLTLLNYYWFGMISVKVIAYFIASDPKQEVVEIPFSPLDRTNNTPSMALLNPSTSASVAVVAEGVVRRRRQSSQQIQDGPVTWDLVSPILPGEQANIIDGPSLSADDESLSSSIVSAKHEATTRLSQTIKISPIATGDKTKRQ
jgi:hypothetical protein